MSVDIGTLHGTVELEDRFSKVFDAFDSQLNRVADNFQKVGLKMEQAGMLLTTRVTAPLALAGGAALKLSTDFNAAMLKISTIGAEPAENLERMKEATLELAPAVAVGPQALAETLMLVESTGISGAKAMELLELSSKGTAVGLGETKDIAVALRSATFAYGESNLSAAKAMDILFSAVKDGGAEANEFADSLGRVLGIAAEMGVSFAEVTGSVATFTRLGVDADEAVTALRGTLSTLLKPAEQTKKALAELGLTTQEVRDKIRKDGLADALIMLEEATNGNIEALGGIFRNIRALAGVLGNAGSQAQEYREIVDRATNSTGLFADAFARVEKTTQFQWGQLIAELQVLGVQIGNVLEPYVVKLIQTFRELLKVVREGVDWFSKLPDPIKAIGVGFLAFSAALGPVVLTLGTFVRLSGLMMTGLDILLKYSGVTAVFKALYTATQGFTEYGIGTLLQKIPLIGKWFSLFDGYAVIYGNRITAMITLTTDLATTFTSHLAPAIGFLTAPLTLVVAGFTAFTVFLLKFTSVGDHAKGLLNDIWKALKSVADIVEDDIRMAWIGFNDILGAIAEGFRDVKAALTDFINFISESKNDVSEFLDSFLPEGIDPIAEFNKRIDQARSAVALFNFALQANKILRDSLNAKTPAFPDLPAGPFSGNRTVQGMLPPELGTPSPVDVKINDSHVFKMSEDLKKAIESIGNANDDLVTKVLALEAVYGKSIEKMSSGTKDDFFKALEAVEEQFGSLEKKGLGRLNALYDQLALRSPEVKKFIDGLNEDMKRASKKAYDEEVKMGKARMDAYADSILAIAEMRNQFAEEQSVRGMTSFQKEIHAIEKWGNDAKKKFGEFSQGYAEFSAVIDQITKNRVAEFVETWDTGMEGWVTGTEEATEEVKFRFQDVFDDISGTILSALKNGGDVLKAIGGQIGEGLGKLFVGSKIGKSISSSLGDIFGDIFKDLIPGIGALLGSLMGKVTEFFSNILGKGAGRKLIEEWAATFDSSMTDNLSGFDELHNKLLEIGREDLWVKLSGTNRKDKKAAQAAIDEITESLKAAEDAMSRAGLSLEDLDGGVGKLAKSFKILSSDIKILSQAGFSLEQIVKGNKDSMNAMLLSVLETGGKIPAALAPAFQEFIKLGLVSDDVARKMLGIAAPAPWKEMEEIAKEFNIDIANLGENFHKSKLGETAEDFAKKFRVLYENGVDLTTIIGGPGGMGEKAQQFYLDFKKYGLELPDTLKPLYAAMIDAGELIDENGEKVTDLGSIQFGKSLAEQLEPLLAKLQELIDVLTVGLPNAVGAGVGSWTSQWEEFKGKFPGWPFGGGSSTSSNPTVTTSDNYEEATSNPSPTYVGTSVVNIDGREAARAVVPFLPTSVGENMYDQ